MAVTGERLGDEAILGQLPAALRILMDLERFNLHEPGRFVHADVGLPFDMRYAPQNCGPFRLPCFRIDRRHFHAYGMETVDANDIGVFAQTAESPYWLFPIHPTEVEACEEFLASVHARDAAEDGLRLWAVPTSSVRTLLVWADHDAESAVFVKMSIRSKTFGDRRISRAKVARSVGISAMLQADMDRLPVTMGFLFEPAGLAPRHLPNFGVVFRRIPDELKSDKIILAPLFSLIGGNARHPPLLKPILERTGMHLPGFVQEFLCEKFAKSWVHLSMQNGLMLEAHGQNLLLALSRNFEPLGRFYYRDLQDVMVDWDLRRVRTGCACPITMPNAWSWHDTYDSGHFFAHVISAQWRTSLGHYMKFVLQEFDSVLGRSQNGDMGATTRLEREEFTAVFSRQIVKAAHELSGLRFTGERDICRFLLPFLRYLATIRRRSINRNPSRFS